MITEYNNLSKGYFVNDKVDLESANETAEKIIRSQWGITEIGGSKRYTKFAPELVYGNQDNWVHKQLEDDYQLPINDLITEVDFSTTNTAKPDYFVYSRNEFEGLDLELNEDNTPKKFKPNYSKSRKAKIDSDITQTNIRREVDVLKNELRSIPSGTAGLFQPTILQR
jgi:hypothetical protein